MDNRPGVRSSKMSRAFRLSFDGLMSGINTSLPGRVMTFDASTQLAEVQAGIMMVTDDGDLAMPPIISVPVVFSGGNEYLIEHQIDPGDEGIIIFSQRCIDAWVDQGGDATQSVVRHFDLTDAMFIPGLRSQAKKIADFKNDGVRIRNKDGSQHVWLKGDGTIDINASTLAVTGSVTVTGSLTADTVDATTGLTSAGKNITTHTHPAGNPPGTTGPNT